MLSAQIRLEEEKGRAPGQYYRLIVIQPEMHAFLHFVLPDIPLATLSASHRLYSLKLSCIVVLQLYTPLLPCCLAGRVQGPVERDSLLQYPDALVRHP